jgi:hypothetical protein
MVDSVNNNGQVSSLLRAQAVGTVALNRTSQQATQTLLNQTVNGANPPAVKQGSKPAGVSGNVPRGSLVDILT